MKSNLIIPGFNPDPSVVKVGADYYLATSSFEYQPGLPVYHSRDLTEWELIGNVIDRPGILEEGVRTAGGIWAPTMRHHTGKFHVIVTDAMGRGNMLFTADDPAGRWSDPVLLRDIDGIDPDLAWDDDGTCYLTFSGLLLGAGFQHLGIQQVRIDLETGRALEEPRSLWSGSGLKFPEAPHLYHVGDRWYLMIAEGGTERGHSVSIARSDRPTGPFVPCPDNPILTASGTSRVVQSTGHGDLVAAPDGSWRMVMLGNRTTGGRASFSPLGRESFITGVDWVDGWPEVEPVVLPDTVRSPVFHDDFDGADLGLEWIGVRRLPGDVATFDDGLVRIKGEGRTMDALVPTFIGRRVCRLDARISASISDRTGVGGLSLRYDEDHHYDIEINGAEVVARARLATITDERRMPLPPGPVVLFVDAREPDGEFIITSDLIALGFVGVVGSTDVAVFDGRFLTAEPTGSFTGRVAGMYCVSGELGFDWYHEEGSGDVG